MKEELDKIDKKLANIVGYLEIIQNPRKFFLLNFFSGIIKGLGMAIGFTILGGILIYIISKLSLINIPIIGDYIAEIVKIVQEKL